MYSLMEGVGGGDVSVSQGVNLGLGVLHHHLTARLRAGSLVDRVWIVTPRRLLQDVWLALALAVVRRRGSRVFRLGTRVAWSVLVSGR